MFDSRLITGKLKRWEKFMKRYELPSYDEIPNLGLYMDQVLTLMGQYLAILTNGDVDNNAVTAATINNYVRVKVMPAPEKKKYLRIHIAYLLIICTLKQSMSIGDIQKLIPADLTEDEMRSLYSDYARCFKESVLFFVNEVKDETDRILSTGVRILENENAGKKHEIPTVNTADENNEKNDRPKEKKEKEKEKEENLSPAQKEFDLAVKKLMFSAATISNFSKLLTSKIVGLENTEYTEEAVSDRVP